MNEALDALLKSQPALWRGRDQYSNSASVPTGFAALDNALPSQGWGIGCLTELILEQEGIGELSLLLPALQRITFEGQWAVLINPPYIPYAPALTNAGIKLDRLLIINSGNDKDTLWATEHVLRTGVFAAVIAWTNRSSVQQQRRLQLASEVGNTWATLFRPATASQTHSPAAVRIVLDNIDKQLSLNIIKARGGKPQLITINPTEFDASQGVEWPGIQPMPMHLSSLRTASLHASPAAGLTAHTD